MIRQSRNFLTVALALLVFAAPLRAQNTGQSKGFRLGFEVKTHLRDSDPLQIDSPFPFEDLGLPEVFLETVEPGSNFEVSVVTLFLDAEWGNNWAAKIKLDLIDRHDRNPTSADDELDVDEAWLRWGREFDPGEPRERGGYLKIGKFPKFERQDDRHLESYGLVSTAFNRFEDVGVELGIDFTDWLYFKSSYTQGNPLFFRDPNALAGDNGIATADGTGVLFPSELGSGFPIFYDADVELGDLDFEEPETGLGLGVHFSDPGGHAAVDILVWRYERDLAETVDLTGTLYGGDLDLLDASEPLPLLPGRSESDFRLTTVGREKEETGANLWLYIGDFSFFGQYVDAELAGIPREAFEAEAAWAFDLPYVGSAGGRQLFSYIQPAVRFSHLKPEVTGGPLFPSPSVRWEWDKLDVGLRLGVIQGILDLTAEWNLNEFIVRGTEMEADEFLLTLRWRMSRGSLEERE